MAKYTTPITANGTLQPLVQLNRSTINDPIGIEIGGTFGGGTLTLFESISGGTVQNAIKDLTGTAYSTTTSDSFRYLIPGHNNGQNTGPDVILYYTLTGATGPSITVTIQDNQ
ncbi:hypothetical protein UFOVP826_48 [uncultured Caudovirales phage]|uniref:Uncharacterized protein n=1 Tax=uncultured Caudovirales phage TaxID=2100421 RepID=A0A6J5P0B8_9CAUD|nr:hypothetical protein UFOVP826_48 [uncultured Caudovirales phage]